MRSMRLFIFFLFVVSILLAFNVFSVTVSDSACKADCTMYDNLCHEECDNVNGCQYPGFEYISRYQLTIKELCNLQQKGWLKYFNQTHDVICCDQVPYKKIKKKQLTVETNSSIADISTVSRLINFNGKIVTMYVSVWSTE